MCYKAIRKFLEPIIGEVCWDIFYERVNLSFKLGSPKLSIMENHDDPVEDRRIRCLTGIRSEWFFWITYGCWELEVLNYSGEVLTASSLSTNRKKAEAIRFLWGQRLTKMEIDVNNNETKLLFDLDAKLKIIDPKKSSKDSWILYGPNDYCLSSETNGKYSYKPTSSNDDRISIIDKQLTKSIIIQA